SRPRPPRRRAAPRRADRRGRSRETEPGRGPAPSDPGPTLHRDVPPRWRNARSARKPRLLNADSEPIAVPTPDGSEMPVFLEGQFEVGRPPGLKPGTPLDGGFALTMAVPLPA